MICRNCHLREATRERGLCSTCYYTPSIRNQFGWLESRHNHRGVGYRGCGLPEPTASRPGTDEKIAVLATRAEKDLLLHHPKDAKLLLKEWA